jgi:hypothetical protein
MYNVLLKRFARSPLCVLIVVAASAGSILAIAFIFPFSTEQWRNFAGFITVPTVVVGSVMGATAWAFKNPPKRTHAIVASVVVAFGGFVVWSVGGMLEFPFVYAFTQLHIRNATAWDGSPISKILGSDINDLTTDDYIGDRCPDYSPIIIFRMFRQGRLAGYYFAYDTKSNVLVPLSETAALYYPALMPPGDRLVDWWTLTTNRDGGQFGDAILAMPADWFHKIDLRENPPNSRPP